MDKEEVLKLKLEPSDVTAVFVKLKSRMGIFNVQREINDYQQEALMAILPGATLRDLWTTIGFAEKTLFVVSLLVFVVSIVGMIISLVATLNERRREMAILRSIGAKRGFLFSVLIIEACILTLSGIILGVLTLYIALIGFKPVLESSMGLTLGLLTPTMNDFIYLGALFFGAILATLIPGWRAYKISLADGLVVKS